MSIVREWDVSFFLDAAQEQPIDDTVELGDVWEGETREKTIYVRNNESAWANDLTYEVDTRKVTINGPTDLSPGQVAPLIIKWAPDETSIGLKDDLKIGGRLVYR